MKSLIPILLLLKRGGLWLLTGPLAHMSWKEARVASHPIEYKFRQVSSEWGHWLRNGGPNPNP
jgi:hypothetical protein